MALLTSAVVTLLDGKGCVLGARDVSLGSRIKNLGSDGSFSPAGGDLTYTPLSVGSLASTAGSGVALTSTITRAGGVFSDDSGANIGDSVRGFQSRLLLTVEQTGGSIRALQGQLKLLTGIGVTGGIYTALQGYVELVGMHSAKTGSTFSCADLSLEITTALVVESGGECFGLHVETTGAGTITNSGTCAAIGITKASGAASWPVGLCIPTGGVLQGIRIGEFKTGAQTTGGILFATTGDFYTDGQLDTVAVHGASASDLGSGYSAKVGRFRHVIGHATLSTDINHETYGLVGQLVIRSVELKHTHAGLMGTLEGNTTAAIANGAYAYSIAAIIARIGGTNLITATKPIAGFSAVHSGAALASGSSIAYAACATSTGNWTYLLAADNVDNLLYVATGTAYECGVKVTDGAAGDTGSEGKVGFDALARIYIGSTAYYIALFDADSVTGE